MARVGADGAGRGDVGRPDAAVPAAARPAAVPRGQSFVVVEATMRMSQADADELLAPLRAMGPAIDTFRETPTAELGQLHMDPPGPVPAAGDGMLLTGLPDRGGGGVAGARPARSWTRPCSRWSSATSAGRSHRARRTAAPSAGSTERSRCSPSGSPRRRRRAWRCGRPWTPSRPGSPRGAPGTCT